MKVVGIVIMFGSINMIEDEDGNIEFAHNVYGTKEDIMRLFSMLRFRGNFVYHNELVLALEMIKDEERRYKGK